MEKATNFLKNPIFITVLVILIGVVGLVGLIKLFPDQQTNSAPYVEHSWGKADSSIVVVEYGDFQCPGCGNFFNTVEPKIKEAYGDKIKFVFKNFPLTSLHRNAQKASEAAEAAGAQGKYWEYHDLLYTRQANAESWNIDTFVSYAKELGLDTDRFRKELVENTYRQLVKDSANEADAKGFTGTPSIEINGKKFEPTPQQVPTYDEISKELDRLLALQGTPTVTPTATPAGN